MGNYLNPGNSGFSRVRNDVYVDKSGMIELLNATIDTPNNLTCFSKPRRFGKSYAAQMLCAYYDKSCQSARLFDDLAIASSPTYARHLNAYNVIYLDMAGIMQAARDGGPVEFIEQGVTHELLEAYPDLKVARAFHDTLANAAELTGTKFVMIIDEWDVPIRQSGHDAGAQWEYLDFLRALFKNSASTAKTFAAAYMTGILPIKKDKSQSALSDFNEFTMVKPRHFAPYVGFTEDEVRRLCGGHGSDFDQMKAWYDGYSFPEAASVYNPNSVMKAIRYRDFDSYWTAASAADSLLDYIRLDYAGLSKTVAGLLAGIEEPVDTTGFSNDLVTFGGKDDVLTLLVHLGYLAYDAKTQTARIPNEELRMEFEKTIRKVDTGDTVRRVRESQKLIEDTVRMDSKAVAAQIEKVHAESASLFYNSEATLRSVVKLAYFAYGDHYLKFEELPAGAGYADIVYVPKRSSALPALIVELKWNKSAQGAIDQIKARRYPDALAGYGGEALLVGIAYSKDGEPGGRRHECVIEKVTLA